VRPLHADFTSALKLPHKSLSTNVGFFPGSTIGNFTHEEAVRFMRHARTLLGNGSYFILGADLIKEEDTLIRAYDDGEGVTAAFNLNLLMRINRELDGDVDLRAFRHRAVWNDEHSRVEMHLVSKRDQIVEAAGKRFSFKEGETIHTENCHKFSRESLAAIAGESGWRIESFWQSEAPAFAIVLLKAAGS
jgi:dimethylhistidine N-methyltransferase